MTEETTAVELTVEQKVAASAREFLLRRAQRWEEEGQVRRATAAYWELLDYHSGTDESGKAAELLLSQAQKYEEEGQVYQATTVYNRLAGGGGLVHKTLPRHV